MPAVPRSATALIGVLTVLLAGLLYTTSAQARPSAGPASPLGRSTSATWTVGSRVGSVVPARRDVLAAGKSISKRKDHDLSGTRVAVIGIGAVGIVLLLGGGLLVMAGRRRRSELGDHLTQHVIQQ